MNQIQVWMGNKTMDDKKQEFTATITTIKISSPFINQTETTGSPVRFDCTDAMWSMHLHLHLRKPE